MLSRPRTLDGLHLINFHPKAIYADKGAVAEYNRLRQSVGMETLPPSNVKCQKEKTLEKPIRTVKTTVGDDENDMSQVTYKNVVILLYYIFRPSNRIKVPLLPEHLQATGNQLRRKRRKSVHPPRNRLLTTLQLLHQRSALALQQNALVLYRQSLKSIWMLSRWSHQPDHQDSFLRLKWRQRQSSFPEASQMWAIPAT